MNGRTTNICKAGNLEMELIESDEFALISVEQPAWGVWGEGGNSDYH